MANKMNSKKSQVTAFILIGVVILAGVIFYFLVAQKKILEINKPTITEPESYIEKCARDAAVRAINIMLPQGGWITPSHFKMINGTNISYLCYTNNFYEKCRAQEPMYIRHLESEITSYIIPVIEKCFDDFREEFENNNYNIDMENNIEVETQLLKGLVKITIEKKITAERNGETRNFGKFSAVFNSPIYSLAIAADEIINQEASYCNFEYVGFMALYPEYKISKIFAGSGENATKIYSIQDEYSGKILNIAVRGCIFSEIK